MELKLYPLLSWKAQRNFIKRKFRYGKEVEYKPHGVVIRQLKQKTGMDAGEIYEQLRKERAFLLKSMGIL